MSYVSIQCRTSAYDVVRQHTMSYTIWQYIGDSMGAAGVAGISPSRACRLFWHGCSRLPKHVVLSFWTSLRVSKRTKSPGQTAHVISAQRAPSTLPPARAGHLQYLQKLQADLACEDNSEEVVSPTRTAEDWLARNDSISCELGIRYPVLQAILSGRKNHQSLMVRVV